MELLFVHAKSNINVNFDNVNLDGKIGIVTTIQYADSIKRLCKGNYIFCGQILGCNFNNAFKKNKIIDKYLYVGTGRFHAIGLALKTEKDVYILNPISNEFYKLNKREIENYKIKKKSALLKFFGSEKIGLLVTLKLGQYTPRKYAELKEKINNTESIKILYPGKKFYIFVFNTLRKEELANFKDIECWINMACPRIADDYDIANFEDIVKLPVAAKL